MHPIDELGQPAAIVLLTLYTLAAVDRWRRQLAAQHAADAEARRLRDNWLAAVWLDVDTLAEVR